MRNELAILGLLLVTAALGLAAVGHSGNVAAETAPSPITESIWRWFEGCDSAQVMDLMVSLNGKTVHRASVPVCKADQRGSDKIVVFYFSGGRKFNGHSTRRSQTVEGNIWLAGSDPDALLLGVSLKSGGRGLLNTIHIAEAARISKSQIDRDLVVTSYHVRRKATSRSAKSPR